MLSGSCQQPLGRRVCVGWALWQVRASHPRKGDDQRAYLQPFLLPGVFLLGKGCWAAQSLLVLLLHTVQKDVLATGAPAGSKAVVWMPNVSYCNWSPSFWQPCQPRPCLLLVPVAVPQLCWHKGLSGCMVNHTRDWPGITVTCWIKLWAFKTKIRGAKQLSATNRSLPEFWS